MSDRVLLALLAVSAILTLAYMVLQAFGERACPV